MLITLWDASNSPDWVTVASSPAKATSFLGVSNLEMSPISLMMTAPVTLPIPVMVVMGDSSFPMILEISAFVSFSCFSIKEICPINVLSWNVKLFLAKVMPKEEAAAAFNCSALIRQKLCIPYVVMQTILQG